MIFIIGGGLKRLADTAQKNRAGHGIAVYCGRYCGGAHSSGFHSAHAPKHFTGSMFHESRHGSCCGTDNEGGHALRRGQGLYSNEAGEGSAAVIHSAAQVDHPARQGFYGVVEVFVDTMVICSTTGFSILASGVPLEGASAASLAAEAFGTVSPLFKYVVSVSLILFASTSIMSQWYFGHVSLMYIKSLKGDRFTASCFRY